MKKLKIIIICIIAISFCAVGCGEKEEEKTNSKQLVQPPADPEEKEENLKKSWKEIKKEMTKKEEENTLDKRIEDVENSKEYTEEEKEIFVKRLIEEDLIRKKYKKKLEKFRKERGIK